MTRLPLQIIGIINVTPDSFSDGGRFVSADDAIETALDMIEQGADGIDVGGESTRPGAQPVAVEVEIARVVPVIAGIRRGHATIPISIDTSKAAVAEAAIAAGATIINDVTAGSGDPAMFPLAARACAGMILMHMQGTPRTMQAAPTYIDVVAEVRDYLVARMAAAEAAGIPRAQLILDPGIGFGKAPAHNVQLLQHIDALVALGPPVMVGISRKSLIGYLLGGCGATERLEGGLALMALAAQRGATYFRVHEIPPIRRFLTVWHSIMRA